MINAVAYCGNNLVSEGTFYNFEICTVVPESAITIDEQGYITSCSIRQGSLVFSDTKNGIPLQGLAWSSSLYKEVTEIFLPDSVEVIEDYACKNLSSLRYFVAIGAVTVGESAFNGCVRLREVYITYADTVGDRAFQSTYSIDNVEMDSLKTIGYYTFANSGLKSGYFPNLESIEESAFEASALRQITCPKVSEIGIRAFERCLFIKDIDLPYVLNIPSRAFNMCRNLENIALPAATQIGAYSIGMCPSLNYLNLPNVITVDEYAFSGWGTTLASLWTFHYRNSVRVDFLKLVTLNGVPKYTNTLVLPSTLTICTATNYYSPVIVYGTDVTYAQTWANTNNNTFRPVPYITQNCETSITDETTELSVEAIGFNITYQWYTNT